MQIGELYGQHFGLVGICTFERLANRVDPIGDTCKPGREHVQEGRDAREQKYRRERHLNDVGDRVESRSGSRTSVALGRYRVTRDKHPRTRMKFQRSRAGASELPM